MQDESQYRSGDKVPRQGFTMADFPDLLTLPFDQFRRYSTAARVADSVRAYLGKSQLRVLDVGGFHRTRRGLATLPLIQFLPSDLVVATDLAESVLPNYVRANGAALPFAPEAFELVVTCDTLEHVLPPSRTAFISELLRVASHCVFLIGPFDDESTSRAERLLYNRLAAYGYQHEPLSEHIERGLPSAENLRTLLAQYGLPSIDFPDGYLPNWLAMMSVNLTPGLSSDMLEELDRFYNRHLSPFDRREPSYRRAFAIAKQGHDGLIATITDASRPDDISAFPDPSFVQDLAHLLQGHTDEWGRASMMQGPNRGVVGNLKASMQPRFDKLPSRFRACALDLLSKLARKRTAGG